MKRTDGGAADGPGAWPSLPALVLAALVALAPGGARAAEAPADLSLRIARYCGDCHALPRPESFRAADWHGRIRLAYEYHARSGRTDLDAPPIAAVTAWYVARAPVTLAPPALPAGDGAAPVRFDVVRIPGPAAGAAPGTADLRWLELPGGPRLVVCDMLRGEVAAFDPARPQDGCAPLAAVAAPCRVRAGAEGAGLVVADLGSVDAFDHPFGRALRLEPAPRGGPWTIDVLAGGLGRVADVLPWDDPALGPGALVAEFGFHRSGSLLRAPADGAGAPVRLDDRAGAVELALHDADGDGRRDVVALFGQEHEALDAFLDRGGGRFVRRSLWRGADLALGSNSLTVADVDGDGDEDLLLTHGDAFDNRLVTPWHGLRWIERGPGAEALPRWLVDLPGAARARAADFDGDGDTDLVVATWLPADVDRGTLPPGPLPSLVLLDGQGGGRFTPHVLERGCHAHPALEAGDFDGDGDVDLAVGTHASGLGADGTRFALWWNRRGEP